MQATPPHSCHLLAGSAVSLADSFGVFVVGSVFKEDAEKWMDVLLSYWTHDPMYAQTTIEIGQSELYYTRLGYEQELSS